MATRSPSLRLIQGIAVAITARDQAGTQQGLRVLASVEPLDAESMLRALSNALSPADRFWLANLHGPRRSVSTAGKLQAA